MSEEELQYLINRDNAQFKQQFNDPDPNVQ